MRSHLSLRQVQRPFCAGGASGCGCGTCIMLALILALTSLSALCCSYVFQRRQTQKELYDYPCFSLSFSCQPPFKVSAYLERIEQVYLSIQKTAQPVDWTIILWLGLDGLQINPDGTSAWIRRSSPAPQGCDTGLSAPYIPALSGPWPSYWLPTPPPPGVSVLYADNRVVEIAAPIDPTMTIQDQLNTLRMKNAIMSLQRQLEQTCAIPPFDPRCIQNPKNKRN